MTQYNCNDANNIFIVQLQIPFLCLFMIIVWELSLFCVLVYVSTYFCTFHCISPVPPKYTIILLLLPNILYRCCCYSCVEYLPSRYVKKINWDFLVYWTSAIFLPIFSIFQCIPPMFTLMYAVKLILHTFTYHTEHVITLGQHLIMLYCMSCYYHSHLIILYLAQILGFWVKNCEVK